MLGNGQIAFPARALKHSEHIFIQRLLLLIHLITAAGILGTRHHIIGIPAGGRSSPHVRTFHWRELPKDNRVYSLGSR
jgi:hypothetical protein